MLNVLFDVFNHVEKRSGKIAEIDLKIYDVIVYTRSKYKTHIAQYLKKEIQPDNEIWSFNNLRNIFLEKS